MTKLTKQKNKKNWRIILLSSAAIVLMRVLGTLMRGKVQSRDHVEKIRATSGAGLIFALWHGPHFPILWTYRHRNICVIASQSGDGEILSRILNHYGYTTVRGSSTRGGIRALVDLAKTVRRGTDASIAIDGPKGPRYQAKPGVLILSKLTGSPIVPTAAAISRYWEFSKSWDHYRLPKPFSKKFIIVGEPFIVPRDATDQQIESYRLQLEENMCELQTQADQAVGNPKKMQAMLDYAQKLVDQFAAKKAQ